MSAVIGLKTGDGAILFTDRAVYDRRFVVRELKQKVRAANTVPLAVATRGNELWSERASEIIVELADEIGVDAAIAEFGEAAPDRCAFEPDLRNHLEVVIGCLSPTHGPQLLVYRNVALLRVDGQQTFGETKVGTFEDAGASYLGAGSDGSPLPTLRKQRPGEPVIPYASMVGLTIMEHYRRMPLPPSEWDIVTEPKHVVGGGVDMTIINGNGVEIRSITNWPDKVGSKIYPTGRPLNRHERRAAARRAA